MNTTSLYRQIREMIAAKRFEALCALEIIKPQQFNWVAEVFENIHVQDTPDAQALIWTDSVQTKTFSFHELSLHCNRFLHFLRKHQLQQQDVIFSQMPLLPENWLTVLVSIKGGFRLIPAATILSVHDIVYRFGKLMPNAVVADLDNAIKIDEAEVLSGKLFL
jgi:acyl-coenzyme A synthetase/AMP-(fatty) acid ligase